MTTDSRSSKPRTPQAAFAHRHRRRGAGRRPRHAARGRHGRRRLAQAPGRHRLVLERDHAVQPVAGQAGQAGQGRGPGRGWFPFGIRDDLGLRRHLDGPFRHALLAGVPGGDRRLGGDGVPGRATRRCGAAGRLRQVAARHADGGRPAGRRRGVPLRRLHLPGPAQRKRRHHHRCLRGGRRVPGRPDQPGRTDRDRKGDLSRRGRLRRHVHGQHDGGRGRGARHVADRLGLATGPGLPAGRLRRAIR